MNPTPIHPKLAEITERIIERSRPTREKYLAKIRSAKQMGRLERNQLGCSNPGAGADTQKNRARGAAGNSTRK